jgi:hypothetical protein
MKKNGQRLNAAREFTQTSGVGQLLPWRPGLTGYRICSSENTYAVNPSWSDGYTPRNTYLPQAGARAARRQPNNISFRAMCTHNHQRTECRHSAG